MITDSVWYKGFALFERLEALKARGTTLPRLSQGVSEIADRRMQAWYSQEPFSDQQLFAQRLSMDAIDDEEFRSLLAGEIAPLTENEPQLPTWLDRLTQALSDHKLSTHPYTLPEQGAGAFLTAFSPLIGHYRTQLLDGMKALVQEHPSAPFVPQDGEALLWENVVLRLTSIVSRTMVLELQVARLQDRLQGETPEARFHSFIYYISQEHVAQSLLEEYPVLARVLTTCLEAWVEASLEFLSRLCADWQAILQTFAQGEEPGLLVKMEVSGDYHRRGRAVALLGFSSGFRLVYKPKSLDADENFQALLSWLNRHGQEPELRPTRMINRGTYGWCEFLAFQPCTSSEEVARFYQREAGLLAVLYLLAATDFHYENILAVGEHPMLVDYESLFHPAVRTGTAERDERIRNVLDDTVFSVGLLPRRTWGTAEFAGVNLSGLGGDFAQVSPREGTHWFHTGTDEMHMGRKHGTIAGKEGHNLPILNGQQVSVLEHREAFVAGFTATYQLLLQHRAELQASDGPLARFADNELRLLVRPTYIYSLMLRESYHPDLLRDGLERDRFFEKLWKPAKLAPTLPQFIPFERADLWQGDFPIFFVRPDSHHIWSSSGEHLENVLLYSGMERVQRNLQRLSEADLQWQQWIIQASLTALTINTSDTYAPQGGPLPEVADVSQASVQAQALRAACAVGDRLVELAQRERGIASWVGLRAYQEQYWDVALLDLRLYAGLPGVALFLAYLGQQTSEQRYTALAKEAVANIRRQLIEEPTPLFSIGAFDGYGGLIYAFTHLATLWESAELFVEAENLGDTVLALLEKDQKCDIIDGAAGCIGSLLSLYERRPSPRTRQIMIQCGQMLLKKAQVCTTGIGWVTALSPQPLAGFSHGSAGIAWALLRLAAVVGMPQFAEAALATIAYERSLFSPEQQNWSDLRIDNTGDTGETPTYMSAWCHGAPGIGLARVAALSSLDTAEVREEIAQAIATTLASGFGRNHSLCHGDLGNLELLLLASQTLADQTLQEQTWTMAARLLASIEQHGWLCGVPLKVENPGFMAGLAGIGYELLRLANPEMIPSVLVLESPRQR